MLNHHTDEILQVGTIKVVALRRGAGLWARFAWTSPSWQPSASTWQSPCLIILRSGLYTGNTVMHMGAGGAGCHLLLPEECTSPNAPAIIETCTAFKMTSFNHMTYGRKGVSAAPSMQEENWDTCLLSSLAVIGSRVKEGIRNKIKMSSLTLRLL